MAEPSRTPRTIAEKLNKTKPAGEPKPPWASTPMKAPPPSGGLIDKPPPAQAPSVKNLR